MDSSPAETERPFHRARSDDQRRQRLLRLEVRAGTLDLALVGTATAQLDGLHTFTIISEPLVVAVPAGHPLAGRDRVRLRDLVQHPIACLPPGTGLRTVFDQACAARGLRPAITLQASAADAIADLAARGLAVAVLSESMAAGYRDRLTALVIEDLDTPALLALVWKSTSSPAVRELLGQCRRAFTGSVGADTTVPTTG